MADNTDSLLERLRVLDTEEDGILDALVRQGAELEEAQRRANMVTVADLRTLGDGMTALEASIAKLRAEVAQAEAASTPPAPPAAPAPPAPPAANAAPASNGHDATPAAMTFEQLAAKIRAQDAEADRLKEILRERLLALKPPAPAPQAAAPQAAAPQAAAPAAPVPAGPRTLRIARTPMTGGDVEAFQHDLNRRFRAWGSKQRVREDGVYGANTRLAARRVLRRLGFDHEDLRHGITPGMQRVVHKAPRPTPRPKPGATGSTPAPQGAKPRPAAPPAGSVQAAIRKHGGRYEDIIVREAKRHGLPISLVCAVLDKESDFRNVYGADNGRRPNPVRSRPGAPLAVTEENYKQYRAHLRAGKDANGVGPMQLTFPGFQERADKLGGCWKVGPNIRVGCEVLADNIKRLGTREGVRAYNGSGDDARRYAASVLELQATWQQIVAGKPVAPTTPVKPGPAEPAHPRVPRTFKAKGSVRGEDVRLWQVTLRKQFRTWQVDYPLAVDGHYGPVTRSATSIALKGLGIAQDAMRDGVSPELRRKVRRKHLTATERARYAARAGWRRSLRKQYAHKGVAPLLTKIITSAHGWKPGHDGVDLICGANVPIMAICDAEVIDVRGGGWWGNKPTGDVSKGDGIIQLKCLTDAGPFKRGMHFGYGHAEHAVVKKGQRVKAGEVIGKAGFANAWHIHFMVNGGNTMKGIGDRDPMPFVNYAMKHGR